MKDVIEEKSTNDFEKKASVLKKIKYVLIVLLVFLILFFLVGYREDITLENIRYLLKYVDVSPAAIGSDDVQTIRLDTKSAAVTDVFRSELITLTKNELKTYDLSAKEGIVDSVSLTTPTLSVGSKYFSLYDLGDNYFALYNSFSKIYEETTAYPIWDVVISDNNDFCVITAEEGYRSALKIYNSDFENKMNWYTADKYIVSADIHGKRDVFVVAGCIENSETGDFLSSVSVLRDGSDKVESYVEFPSEMLLDTKFFENGNVCVLTDSALRVLDLAGKVLTLFEFSSESLRMFDSAQEYAALVLNENSIGTEHRLIILDDAGNTSLDTEVLSDISDLCISKDTVLLLGTQSLACVDIEKQDIVFHATDKSYSTVHPLSDKRAILIYDDLAYVVSVK